MANIPSRTVTFLFTDIEGSTRLLQELGRERYGVVQDDHSRLMREAITAAGGAEIRTEGDSFFVVFPTAGGAVQAAVAAQRALHATPGRTGNRCGCGWGCTVGRGIGGATTTSGSTSTGQPASPPQGTADRFCSRPPPGR